VEVGVLKGGSLFMWREFFGPKARIVGIDLNPRAKQWEEDGFEIYIGSQSDPSFWKKFLSEVGPIDVFLDDGGHTYVQQIITSECVLDSISDGGMLVVEDTHTSYLEGFGAQTHSFVKYAKIWIDRINSRFCEFNTDQSGRKVWSMEIFDSIIAFKINKDSSELKSEEICSVEEAQYDGDFRAEDNVIVENKSEEITPIMQGAFSVEGLPNENNVVSEGDVMITKNQLVGLVENWLEQKPEAKDELLDLISKSCKT
jgi:hypothetical protein|tara:strand:+ start:7598 stop:8365 length:768 start_codon:yes stop_codon:yes gene_type:complete